LPWIIKNNYFCSGGRRGEFCEEERSQKEQKSGEEINQNQEAYQLQVGVARRRLILARFLTIKTLNPNI